jgi:hypothetical protein
VEREVPIWQWSRADEDAEAEGLRKRDELRGGGKEGVQVELLVVDGSDVELGNYAGTREHGGGKSGGQLLESGVGGHRSVVDVLGTVHGQGCAGGAAHSKTDIVLRQQASGRMTDRETLCYKPCRMCCKEKSWNNLRRLIP